jgi:hypothetical protein
MTGTRDKLNEARYFLELMAANQNQREPLKYCLSAFLAAAQSITWFLQKEYDKTAGFKSWYEQQRERMKSDETMKVLHDKRVVTTHREPLDPHAHVNLTISDTITISDSASVIVHDSKGNEVTHIETERPSKQASEPKPSTAEWKWYFDEIPGRDLLSVCTEYLGKMDTPVTQCETIFGRPTR